MTDDTKPDPDIQYRGTGFYVSLMAIGLLVIALLALALQNTESVRFEFLPWVIEIPLFGLVIATALVTIVIDELVGLVWRRRRRRRLTERRELERLRRQVGKPSATAAAEVPVTVDTTAADPEPESD